MRDVLPHLTETYKATVDGLAQKHAPDSAEYSSMKQSVNGQHMKVLDKLVAYASECVELYQRPSIATFRDFAGLNGEEKNAEQVILDGSRRKSLTKEYLTQIARKYKGKTTDGIRIFEAEIGNVGCIDYSANHERGTVRLNFQIGGSEDGYERVSINARKSDFGGDEKSFLLALCTHVLGKKEIDQAFRATTSASIVPISRYLGGQ